MALITSSFETGPTEMWETGTFCDFRYSSKASKDPSVEADTPTPNISSLNFFWILSNSSLTMILAY